jgi:hypothetical protein
MNSKNKAMIPANTTIFITYNPDNGLEQTLASRLHTIGAVNGFRMYMPDRFNANNLLDSETIRRINLSDYFIVFSFGNLSNTVKQEIETAYAHLQDPTRIIVVYDRRKGKNLTGQITEHFKAFDFDPAKQEVSDLVKEIISSINHRELLNQLNKERKAKEDSQALNALLGIGLGLFALAALSKSDK